MYTDYVCGNVPLTEHLERTPLISLYSSFPSSSQISTSAPTTLATPTLSSNPSHRLNTGQIAGIAVGSVLSVSLLAGLLSFLCIRRHCSWPHPGQISPSTPGEITPTEPHTKAETDFEGTTTSGGLTVEQPGTVGFIRDFKNSIIFCLLCLFGAKGVPLRELVELIHARYALSRAKEPCFGYPPCSRITESPFRDDVTPSSISAFLQAVAEPENLHRLEQDLMASGIIRIVPDRNVKDQGQKQGSWTVDCRIWKSQDVAEDIDDDRRYSTLQSLFDVFDGMPDKTSHPLAERYREVYYNHGHVFLTRIGSLDRVRTPDWNLFEQLHLSLLLKTLTHRHQDNDMALLYTAFDLSSESAVYSYEWVLLRLAKLKGFAHSQKYRCLRSTEKSMSSVILADMQNLLKNRSTTADARDAAGYVLVELIDIAEISQSSELLRASVETSEAWCQQALEWAVLPEHSALSCVLVKLKCWNQLKLIPEEGHLSCGYYLSRAGVLDQAEQFLRSGLGHSRTQTIPNRSKLRRAYWRYNHELLTVIMRSGRWSEAQGHLIAMFRQDCRPVNALDPPIVMGDYGEYALTTACLLADCYVAKGSFNEAELLLRGHLYSIIGMRDDYIRTTRLTIESRLLNIQLQLPLPGDILHTALLLSREISDPGTFALDPDIIEWTVQELFVCVNRLISVEQYIPARQIIIQMRLNSIPVLKDLFEGSDSYLTDKFQAIELALAVDQRQGESILDRTSKARKSLGDQVADVADPVVIKKDSSQNSAKKGAKTKPLTEDIQIASNNFNEPKLELPQGGGRMQDPEKQQAENLGQRKTLFKKASIVSEGQRPSALRNALNMLRLVRLKSPPTNMPAAATEEKKTKAEVVPILTQPTALAPARPDLPFTSLRSELYSQPPQDRIMELT